MRAIVLALSGLLVFVACGGSAPPDLPAWDSEVASARTRVTDYQALVATTPPAFDCTAERDRYVTELKPRLARMHELSGVFDLCFQMMHHVSFADVESMCSDSDFELNRYSAAGCLGSTAERSRADALEHCRRMLDFLDRAASRSSTMRGMLTRGETMMGWCR